MQLNRSLAVLALLPIMAFGLSACSQQANNSQEGSDSEKPAIEHASSPDNEVSFDQYNLLTFDKDNKLSSNDFTIYTVQNTSDIDTISSPAFEFTTKDGDGNDLHNALADSDHSYPIALDPRGKMRLQLNSVVPDANTTQVNNTVTRYSYDLDGMHYTIDLDSKVATADEAAKGGNTSFADANVLAFSDVRLLGYRSRDFVNNGDVALKSLKATVACYDKDNTMTGLTDVDVLPLGSEAIEPGGKGTVEVDEISAHKDGHIEIVSYTYEIGVGNADGYNKITVNITASEASGEKNALALNSSNSGQTVDAKAEIDTYAATFGKKITDIDITPVKTEKQSGTVEWLYLDKSTKFLGLSGQVVLCRNYDTLLINGVRFDSDVTDEKTQTAIMSSLTNAYGDNYKATMKDDKLDYATWTLDGYHINFFPKSCIVTVLAND